ncbi:uncharacterized protein Tco_1498516, partial [Tanacetum coccineum]
VDTTPYPSALEKPTSFPYGKRGPQADELWETFKHVKINLPLIEAIRQIPVYAKILKDLCTQKRRHQLPKKVELGEQVSAVLSSTLPRKLKDPGAPLISVDVGNLKIKRALLDLGASVNVLPRTIFDKHDFGQLKNTDVFIQLADQSTKVPRGMLTDVIVKVEDFYYPVDFIVLDTEATYTDRQQTIILGRPFLATVNSQINCRNGAMDISFGNRKMRLNVFNNISNAPIESACFMVDTIDDCIQLHTTSMLLDDNLEKFLFSDDRDDELLDDIALQGMQEEFLLALE